MVAALVIAMGVAGVAALTGWGDAGRVAGG